MPLKSMAASVKALAKARNALVHRGAYDVGDTELNMLKTVCEYALQWLTWRANSLPTTAHLEAFYSLRTAPVSQLVVRANTIQAEAETIRFLQRGRF